MRAPTLRFSLDVPTLLKLQEKARQHHLSITKFLQNLVNEAIQATPDAGRKVGNTDDGTEQQNG